MATDTVHIAYVLSREFLVPFMASATSVVENASVENLQITVLHKKQELGPEHQQKIREQISCSVRFVGISDGRLQALDNPRFGVEAFYKLLVPQALAPAHKAIYLDCDTIVLGDIAELYDVDVSDHVLAAVQDVWIPYVSAPDGVLRWEQLGYEADTPFFNSGVLLLNLRRLRRMDLVERTKVYVQAHRERMNKMGDQEVQNALLAGRWKELDLAWNVLPPVYRRSRRSSLRLLEEKGLCESDVTSRAKIIHYTGFLERPWKPESLYARRQPHPARSIFNRYVRRSGWFTLPELVRYHLSFYAGRTAQTLRDFTRPLRHSLRKLTARTTGIDPSFLGGDSPVSR